MPRVKLLKEKPSKLEYLGGVGLFRITTPESPVNLEGCRDMTEAFYIRNDTRLNLQVSAYGINCGILFPGGEWFIPQSNVGIGGCAIWYPAEEQS